MRGMQGYGESVATDAQECIVLVSLLWSRGRPARLFIRSNDSLRIDDEKVLLIGQGRIAGVAFYAQGASPMPMKHQDERSHPLRITIDEPLEPAQEDVLMVLMAETGNTFLEETYPVEVSVSDEGQGGSLGNNESVQEPLTPSTPTVALASFIVSLESGIGTVAQQEVGRGSSTKGWFETPNA